MSGPPTLALANVSKSFGAVRALRDVSLELFPGEAHALAGENGAGKSTLVKTLAGVHRPDSGQVLLGGEPVDVRRPGRRPAGRRGGHLPGAHPVPRPVGRREHLHGPPAAHQPGPHRPQGDARARPRRLFERLGVTLDPEQPARGLSIADQQLVEIAKAISRDARVLIMDEPTAALSGNEVARLFSVARGAARAGLRDPVHLAPAGRDLRALPAGHDAARRRLDRQRARRRVSPTTTWSAAWSAATSTPSTPSRTPTAGEVALQVERLTREGVFTDVSFQVRRGEIVALAGLVGAGRSEVARAVFGVDRWDAGSVTVAGRPLPARQPHRRDGAPGWPWCPRTGASRAWSWSCRSSATSA